MATSWTGPTFESRGQSRAGLTVQGSRRSWTARSTRAGPTGSPFGLEAREHGTGSPSRPSKLDGLTGSPSGSKHESTVQGSRAHGSPSKPSKLDGPKHESRHEGTAHGLTAHRPSPRSWNGLTAHRPSPRSWNGLTGQSRAGLTRARPTGSPSKPSKLDRPEARGPRPVQGRAHRRARPSSCRGPGSRARPDVGLMASSPWPSPSSSPSNSSNGPTATTDDPPICAGSKDAVRRPGFGLVYVSVRTRLLARDAGGPPTAVWCRWRCPTSLAAAPHMPCLASAAVSLAAGRSPAVSPRPLGDGGGGRTSVSSRRLSWSLRPSGQAFGSAWMGGYQVGQPVSAEAPRVGAVSGEPAARSRRRRSLLGAPPPRGSAPPSAGGRSGPGP